MKNPSLQLFVYGPNVSNAVVTTDTPHVSVEYCARLDSPNYLIIYLNIEGAQPGLVTLCFIVGKKKQYVKYLFKEREMDGEQRIGFSNADVLYLLIPDRFASSGTVKANENLEGMLTCPIDRTQPCYRHGGDLEGIRQHLDYFNQLGVTTLWLTPVLENNATPFEGFADYHGYAITDYYKVDPHLGTIDEYKRLVDEAHQHGLKIVMDMVFNHCGINHPWMLDLPSHDWFFFAKSDEKTKDHIVKGYSYQRNSFKLTPVVDPYASKMDLSNTLEGWFVPTMPANNLRKPCLMTYFIQCSIWWIETAGIDGIRMDTYAYADPKGMALWMKIINEEYPHFNTVGEIWVAETAFAATWQKDSKSAKYNSHLKTVMDFSFHKNINLAKDEETDSWSSGLNRIYNNFVYDYLYPCPEAVMAFIENHDTDRFLGNTTDTASLKQALALLLTVNRTPQLYYGTEVLMNGTKEVCDAYVRKDFPGGFPGDENNCFTKEGRTSEQNDMFDWLSRLLHWRQGNNLVTKGKQTHFIPYNGIYVLARQYAGRTVMTILNGTWHEAEMNVKRYAEVIGEATTAHEIFTNCDVRIDRNIILYPRQTMVIEF